MTPQELEKRVRELEGRIEKLERALADKADKGHSHASGFRMAD